MTALYINDIGLPKKGKGMKPQTPEVELVLVTPDIARSWLNGHNRALRETVWQRYARDMTEGFWALNGETIKRTTDGDTIDGQHRLKAVAESGVSVWMFVVNNLPPLAQETIDRGLPRGIPDAFRLRGEKDVNNLAAAVAQVVVIKSPAPTDTTYWPSTSEAIVFLGANPAMREACQIGSRVKAPLRTPASTAAAMWFIFQEIDSDDADAFFERLITGTELEDNSPILRLREFMFREATAQRRVGRHRLQAYYIKAWNAYREGKPMQLLKWRTGGADPEKFPVPA